MKCPKCKKEMEDKYPGEGLEGDIPDTFVCFNEKCVFWGIERINYEYFKDV